MFLPCGGAKYCKLTGNYTGICTTFQHDQILVELYPEEGCDQKNYDISIEKCIQFNFLPQNQVSMGKKPARMTFACLTPWATPVGPPKTVLLL
jgi:hypothetical protein